MKICNDCLRQFYKQHNDYLFCPYCGKALREVIKEPKEKTVKAENKFKLSRVDLYVRSVERSVERYYILNEDEYNYETSFDVMRYQMIAKSCD